MTLSRQIPSSVRMVLVSSNYLVRVGLRRIMENTLGVILVGESHGGASAQDLVLHERPDIAILDIEPDMRITELTRNLRKSVPSLKIILLSGWDDIAQAKQALTAGASSIVLKCQPPSVLLATVESLAGAATAALLASSNQALINNRAEQPVSPGTSSPPAWPSSLTDRERTVIALLGKGLSNRDIAGQLCISETTVRHHLTSIFDKLGVPNRQKLLIRAHQYGLVELTASA